MCTKPTLKKPSQIEVVEKRFLKSNNLIFHEEPEMMRSKPFIDSKVEEGFSLIKKKLAQRNIPIKKNR